MGGLLGAVAGGIAGTAVDQNSTRRGIEVTVQRDDGQRGAGRGIEVTVQRDDGQQVTVAQRDDGDVQLGDRVQIVQNRQGVAQVVRDNTRNPD